MTTTGRWRFATVALALLLLTNCGAPPNAAAPSLSQDAAPPSAPNASDDADDDAGDDTAASARCPTLSPQTVSRSIQLGERFLLNNQRAAGNFVYAYDWRAQQITAGDSAVRQAGASWGLALLQRYRQQPSTLKASERALDFFARHSRLTTEGERYVVYPHSEAGSLGTVALVTLAHIELARAGVATAQRITHLNQYLRFLRRAHRKGGGFHAEYRHDDGTPFGDSSPYYDGEAVLAWVKAARYLNHDNLRAQIRIEIEAGYQRHVEQALRQDPDSAITKGYYQWASMAYAEMASWPLIDEPRHAERLLALADWMIDVHHTLSRQRNTAYAYEGIIPAWTIAIARGELSRSQRYGCVIAQGLRKLTRWQVGGPLHNPFILARAESDPRALGGIQNHEREPLLRIDVTQHQIHALLLLQSSQQWPGGAP